MAYETSGEVKRLLARPDVHKEWERDFRTPDNEQFYGGVFDYLVRFLKQPRYVEVLDAAYGPGFHSTPLARRDFRVHAIDYSGSILPVASTYIVQQNLQWSGLRSPVGG